mgnify:FL=1
MKYRTIYADPPWPERGGGKIKRGADRHYNLMSVNEIIDMADFVKSLADENCHLYLWTTNNYLPSALEVMKAWGFAYKTTITWVKDRIGLGQYYRGLSEHCLFGVKGNLPYKVIDGRRAQGVTAFYEAKTIHSRKPIAMRQMIEKVSYPPFIELFARQKYENWDVWGNEVSQMWKEGTYEAETKSGLLGSGAGILVAAREMGAWTLGHITLRRIARR